MVMLKVLVDVRYVWIISWAGGGESASDGFFLACESC